MDSSAAAACAATGTFKTAPARAVSGLARRYTTTANHADGRAATLLAALAMFYYLVLLL
ncbi:uncharacterized protein G6M90_00g051220 [Metarhizium brunneum]|uniref:Uncharacterized protein n=1 Tax=Metarhizium brunneum TaxID=500148 RepID=A0A7D5UTA6_9HYPO|nr:hypothetical protein G6M90_00g051220 [Metarhizium brunneum]